MRDRFTLLSTAAVVNGREVDVYFLGKDWAFYVSGEDDYRGYASQEEAQRAALSHLGVREAAWTDSTYSLEEEWITAMVRCRGGKWAVAVTAAVSESRAYVYRVFHSEKEAWDFCEATISLCSVAL